MDYDRICSWLELPAGAWPPDHYRLLGLEPGENNAELIEQRVHERLDTVRRYQMMQPELATEAMNRLAQAFVCLTDDSSKQRYDAQLGIVPVAANSAPSSPLEHLDWLSNPPVPEWSADKPSAERSASETISDSRPPLPAAGIHDEATPPPLRQPPPLPTLLPALLEPQPLAVANPVAPITAAPPLEPVDPIVETAQSGMARRGIGTKRTLYHRIARTRRLLRLWNELGKYLSSPKRRLSRTVDGPELVRLLDEISTLLKDFPPLLGEAGHPGYLVLALTQVDTVKVFQSFSPNQREALSRDWGTGIKLLTAHRDFLRRELRAMRKRPFRQRVLHAGWSLLVDQPGFVLLLLALLALNVALWRTYAEALWEKLFSH